MRKLLLIGLIAVMMIACSPKKYIYFYEDKKTATDSTFYKFSPTTFALKPGDILYITVNSSLTETSEQFDFNSENEGSTRITSGTVSTMYLSQYVIDDSGYIRMPIVGEIFVAGSTVTEAQTIVENNVRKFVSDAMVKVKLVSYDITFLGEFGHPGRITFYKDHVHILDALAQAGEVTFYADRKNIRVMRQTETGLYTYRINLWDKNLMTNEKFYLQPNDIVYAEPTSRRIFRNNAADYAIFLATITSTLALITLIVTISNN